MSKFLFILTAAPKIPSGPCVTSHSPRLPAIRLIKSSSLRVDVAACFTGLSPTERVQAPGGDHLMTCWKFLLVCRPRAQTRLIAEKDLRPGANIGTGDTLIDLAADFKACTI